MRVGKENIVTLRMSDSVYSDLNDRAYMLGLSMSGVIKRALQIDMKLRNMRLEVENEFLKKLDLPPTKRIL